jgi:hypothetical protein
MATKTTYNPPQGFLAKLFPLLGGDFGIVQTVSAARMLVYDAIRDPRQLARGRAEQILLGVQERNEVEEIRALYTWVKNHFHYVNDPVDLEHIKTFEAMERAVMHNGSFFGDCDDGTVYLASLLQSIGYPVNLVIVAPTGAKGDEYRHIYLRAYMRRRGQWMNLDVTAKGKPLGWAVQARREREFPI